jgi:hypothetical protein
VASARTAQKSLSFARPSTTKPTMELSNLSSTPGGTSFCATVRRPRVTQPASPTRYTNQMSNLPPCPRTLRNVQWVTVLPTTSTWSGTTKTQELKSCIEQVYRLPTGAHAWGSEFEPLLFGSLFSQPSPLLQQAVAALRATAQLPPPPPPFAPGGGSAEAEVGADGSSTGGVVAQGSSAGGDPKNLGLRGAGHTTVGIHLRGRPPTLEFSFDTKPAEWRAHVSEACWECAEKLLEQIEGDIVIFLATDTPEYRQVARTRLGKYGRLVFQERSVTHTMRPVEASRASEVDKLPTQTTDPAGADAAVLDWFLIGSVDVLLMSKSSFSCTAAWRGIGQGTLRKIWNYQYASGAPKGQQHHCFLDFDGDASPGTRGPGPYAGSLSSIELDHCAA